MTQRIAAHARNRFRGCLVAILVSAAWVSGAHAGGYRYVYPYGYYYPNDRYEIRQDMKRLRTQIRSQQRQLREQTDLQQEQIRLMRQQESEQQRVTSRQACFYRFDAGMDLCEDLFGAVSPELAACRDKVVEKNPGCAGDIMRAKAGP